MSHLLPRYRVPQIYCSSSNSSALAFRFRKSDQAEGVPLFDFKGPGVSRNLSSKTVLFTSSISKGDSLLSPVQPLFKHSSITWGRTAIHITPRECLLTLHLPLPALHSPFNSPMVQVHSVTSFLAPMASSRPFDVACWNI